MINPKVHSKKTIENSDGKEFLRGQGGNTFQARFKLFPVIWRIAAQTAGASADRFSAALSRNQAYIRLAKHSVQSYTGWRNSVKQLKINRMRSVPVSVPEKTDLPYRTVPYGLIAITVTY
jgi:hypothetical protein